MIIIFWPIAFFILLLIFLPLIYLAGRVHGFRQGFDEGYGNNPINQKMMNLIHSLKHTLHKNTIDENELLWCEQNLNELEKHLNRIKKRTF